MGFLGSWYRRKGQIITSILRLLLEMPNTPTKALSDMCFSGSCYRRRRVIKHPYRNAHNSYENLVKYAFLRFVVQRKGQITTMQDLETTLGNASHNSNEHPINGVSLGCGMSYNTTDE